MPLRPVNREQTWLLPPTLDELLAQDHPARFVAAFEDGLPRDAWSEMEIDLDGDPLGAQAYHPRVLLNVWLYGFMHGIRSKMPVLSRVSGAGADQVSRKGLGFGHLQQHSIAKP